MRCEFGLLSLPSLFQPSQVCERGPMRRTYDDDDDDDKPNPKLPWRYGEGERSEICGERLGGGRPAPLTPTALAPEARRVTVNAARAPEEPA